MADDTEWEATVGELKAALDDIPASTALVDENGSILWQNKKSLALRGPCIGRQVADLIPAAYITTVQSVFEEVLAGGGPRHVAYPVKVRDGSFVTHQARWSLVPLRDGRRLMVVSSGGSELGLHPHAPGLETKVPLTPRQLDVLRLLAAGKRTREIAADLSVSPVTVRNHVANLLSTLGVHSRLQAVVTARDAGLID